MRRRVILAALVLLVVGAGIGLWFWLNEDNSDRLTLYGNVDLRQVELAFNGSERIAEVLVEEGDPVTKGELLAELDTSRLKPQVAEAQAQVAAQQAVVERLRNGSRPEEIAQARANLEAAKADALDARQKYERKKTLVAKSVVSQQEADTAKATYDVAQAQVEVQRKALDLAVAGPRREEIDQAEAQLQMNKARLALLEQQLADAKLLAPVDGVVRSRLMEPGEMATPQKPVYSIAITDPKWVRAYVSEVDLPHIHPGMKAALEIDGFPDRQFSGWVGFISPSAEFTPKSVETEELRTSLVYEVRVFVKDDKDNFRLGMPATVILPLSDEEAGTGVADSSAGGE